MSDSSRQEAVLTVMGWARKRAERSVEPHYFMNQFEDELAMVLNGVDLTENLWDVTDPVHVAAEIEALSAGRILAQWGRRYELTIGRKKRHR